MFISLQFRCKFHTSLKCHVEHHLKSLQRSINHILCLGQVAVKRNGAKCITRTRSFRLKDNITITVTTTIVTEGKRSREDEWQSSLALFSHITNPSSSSTLRASSPPEPIYSSNSLCMPAGSCNEKYEDCVPSWPQTVPFSPRLFITISSAAGRAWSDQRPIMRCTTEIDSRLQQTKHTGNVWLRRYIRQKLNQPSHEWVSGSRKSKSGRTRPDKSK